MQIILSDEEIAYIIEALLTEIQEVKQDVENRKQRGLDEGYREKYLEDVEAVLDRFLPYRKD